MARELSVQREIIQFFTDPCSRGGLGYREVSASQVQNETLLIISDVKKWYGTGRNAKSWSNLIKKSKGDEGLATQHIVRTLSERVRQYANAAIFFQTNKTINVEGFSFFTFEQASSDSSEKLDLEIQDNNLYSIVEELPYTRYDLNRRPDLCFFLNGVYIGYLELKTSSSSGTAGNEGRKKVIGDMLEFVRALPHRSKSENKTETRKALQLWHQAITVSAFDMIELYVTRLPVEFHLTRAFKASNAQKDEREYRESFEDTFYSYPSPPQGGHPEKWMSLLSSHFSKNALQNEIAFFNFLEESSLTAKKPISPRPKQKFGVDKTISRVCELLQQEGNPGFLSDELLSHPRLTGSTEEEKKLALDSLSKKEGENSILLQYSAGFGKTNIICWLALRLKDLTFKGRAAYDKIFLVADRLDLRDQLDKKMFNMNIDKSLFKEASNRSEMIEALDGNSRVVIINIQKFTNLDEVAKAVSVASHEKYRNQRYAFIIDEVHRSNKGTQHKNMMDMFVSDEKAGKQLKNLVIGLTATPSENVLQRFGEIHNPLPPVKYAPFDAFTMKDAIQAGFVHNAAEKIVPLDVAVRFKTERELLSGEKADFDLVRDVYENPDRIEAVASKVTDFVFKHTFKRIVTTRSMGKAMFACKSTKAANLYFEAFTRQFKEYREKHPNEPDVNVYVVFTSSQQGDTRMQDVVPAERLMGRNEKETIQAFKNEDRALIIVVQKLQTGFDDPKLHTLFLDRPISDIEAVQTCCRVNRTMEGKKDCLVVDCTLEHENMIRIKDAFAKYEDVVIADDANRDDLHKEFVEHAETIDKSPLARKFKKDYDIINGKNLDREVKHQRLDGLFRRMIEFIDESEQSGVDFKGMRSAINGFFTIKDEHYHVADLPKSLTENKTLNFYKLVKGALTVSRERQKGGVRVIVEVDYDDVGILLDDYHVEVKGEESGGKKNSKGDEPDEDKAKRMIDRLMELNELDDAKAESRIWYQEQLELTIGAIKDNSQNLERGLRDGKYHVGNAEFNDGFERSLKSVFRKSKKYNLDKRFKAMIDKYEMGNMLSEIFSDNVHLDDQY